LSRVGWEWDKVRHRFRKDDLQAIVDRLRGYNEDLISWGLGTRENLPGTESQLIRNICEHFDERKTRVIREEAQALYDAINSCWGCKCSDHHEGSIRLDWHELDLLASNAFTLAFPSKGLTADHSSSAALPWKPLSIVLEDREIVAAASQDPNGVASNGSDEQVPRTLGKRSRQRDSLASTIPGKRRKLPRGSTKKGTISTQNRRNFSNQYGTAQISVSREKPPVIVTKPATSQHTTLCNLLNSLDSESSLSESIPLPSAAEGKLLRLSTEDLSEENSFKIVSLQTLLSESVDFAADRRLELDRKHRLGVAAALAWGVLYLCDSPWLTETLSDEDICMFIDDRRGLARPTIAKHPYFAHKFPITGSLSIASQPKNSSSPGTAHDQQFIFKQIQNITLYNFAIRLIELGLNRPFSDLREEYYRRTKSQQFGGVGALIEDYDIARKGIERMRSDPGLQYATAAKICLRFFFLDAPETAPFRDRQFRSAFFRTVVAPIQATFQLTPALASDIT
jgi:hypothetical protein